MRCTLMNKNTKVLDFELEENNSISKIYEVYNKDYAPFVFTYSEEGKEAEVLNDWLYKRLIPSFRKDLKKLLNNLGVNAREDLINKSYGLSLSDQYWFKDINNNDVSWDKINFFTNDFEYDAYFDAALNSTSSQSTSKVSLYSPNNTTDGMVGKAWIIENGKRYLLKGAYGKLNIEPINEWLASEISRRMGFSFTPYEITIYNKTLVSKCPCFINENEELISASQIFYSEKQLDNETDFETYVRILEKHGIENAKDQVRNMFLVDYLIGNFDRHLNNYGIIRNVNTLKWERIAPIYDCGSSMCSNITDINDLNVDNTVCKFFTYTNVEIDEIYRMLYLGTYDLSPLKGLAREYENKLFEYQNYLFISDEVIKKLSSELAKRIKDEDYSL